MVSREFATALADDAQIQGKPLFYLANDVVKIYLKARERGYDLEQVIDTYEAMDMMQKMGFTLVSEAFLESLLLDATDQDAEVYATMCIKTGRKMGMFVRSRIETPKEAINKLSRLIPDTHFHFSLDGEKEVLYIACPRRSQMRGLILARLVEGFLDAYDCYSQRTEIIDGLVKIEFSKRPAL